MKTIFTKLNWLFLLPNLFFLVLFSSNANAYTKEFANVNISNSGDVTGTSNFYDGDISTYAEITADPGLLGLGSKSGTVTMAFPENKPAGTDVYIVLSQPGNSTLLRSLLGGSLGGVVNGLLGTLIGGDPTITIELLTTTSTLVQSVNLTGGVAANIEFGPEGYMYLKITSTGVFRRVRVGLKDEALLGIGLLAGETKLRVHDAFVLTGSDDPCNPFVTTTYDATGLTVSLLQSNPNPIRNVGNAIDNDMTTYSELGYDGLLGGYVGSNLQQTVRYKTLSESYEQPVIAFDRNSTILTLDLLNAINITAYNGATVVYSGTAAGILSLDALGILSLTVGSSVPDRISIPVTGPYNRVVVTYAQTVGLGLTDQPLKIYDIQRAPRIPSFSAEVYGGCEGLDLELEVMDPIADVTYEWYTTDLTLIHTGATMDYTYPGDGVQDTILVRAVNACGIASAYQPLRVIGDEITCLPSTISGSVDVSEYMTVNPLNAVLTDVSNIAQFVTPVDLLTGDYTFPLISRGTYTIYIVNEAVGFGDLVTESSVDDGFTITPPTPSTISVQGNGAPVILSPFVISMPPLLSNHFISFNGNIINNVARLAWEVNAQNDYAQFIVQKSFDGVHFQNTDGKIYTVKNQRFYSFNDILDETTSRVFYRVQILDQAGAVSFSQVVKLENNGKNEYNLYPNPASNVISLFLVDGNEKVMVYNTLGQVVYSGSANGNIMDLNISQYIPGVYYVQVLNANNELSRIQFIKY